MTGLFVREGLVVEFPEPDLRVRSRRLLRLDHFVELAQRGVEPCQRRALLRDTTLSLAMLTCRMGCKYFVPRASTGCITRIALRNLVCEKL